MEQIEECNGFKIIIIREESGKLIGARCTYCTNQYPRKAHLIRHCNSAHVGLLQTSVIDPQNELHEAEAEAEKQRLAALRAAADEAEQQRLTALAAIEAAEAEKQRLAALAATEAAEAEKQRLNKLAEEAEKRRLTALHDAHAAAKEEEAEKQRLTALRDKQRVLHAEAEKQRIIALKEAEEAEKQRIIAMHAKHAIEAEEAEKQRIDALREAEEAEKQRIDALREAEEAEKQRISALHAFEAEEAEKLYIKELQTLVADKLKLCDDNDLDIDGIFTLETRNTDFLRAVDFFKNRMGRRKTERHIRRAIMDIKVAMRAKITKSSTNPSKNKTMRIKIR